VIRTSATFAVEAGRAAEVDARPKLAAWTKGVRSSMMRARPKHAAITFLADRQLTEVEEKSDDWIR